METMNNTNGAIIWIIKHRKIKRSVIIIYLINLLIVITECIFIWPAFAMMNETANGRKPELWKLLTFSALQCIPTVIITQIALAHDTFETSFLQIFLFLYSFFLLCLLFTGGLAKIFLSIIILNFWCALAEILTTVIHCILRGYSLTTIFTDQYNEHILQQWILLNIVFVFLLFLFRPLFLKYRNLKIMDNKYWYAFLLLYPVITGFMNARPVGITGNRGWYINTLLVFFGGTIVMIILFGYNMKQLLQIETQHLYLKQKMQLEYSLVFEDINQNIRHFRHDIRKHMDVLDYLVRNQDIVIPDKQFTGYQQSLRNIYEELIHSNFSSQMDINVVLMKTESFCRDRNIPFSISLKDLDTDSLPSYLRMQLFTAMSNWAISEMNQEQKPYMELAVSGTSRAGYHMLNFSLETPEQDSKEQRLFSHRQLLLIHNSRKIKKLLIGYHPSVKFQKISNQQTLIVGWHSLPS